MATSGDTRLNIKIRKYEKRDHDTVCRIFYNGLMENWVRVKVSTNFRGIQYWRRCLLTAVQPWVQHPINYGQVSQFEGEGPSIIDSF